MLPQLSQRPRALHLHCCTFAAAAADCEAAAQGIPPATYAVCCPTTPPPQMRRYGERPPCTNSACLQSPPSLKCPFPLALFVPLVPSMLRQRAANVPDPLPSVLAPIHSSCTLQYARPGGPNAPTLSLPFVPANLAPAPLHDCRPFFRRHPRQPRKCPAPTPLILPCVCALLHGLKCPSVPTLPLQKPKFCFPSAPDSSPQPRSSDCLEPPLPNLPPFPVAICWPLAHPHAARHFAPLRPVSNCCVLPAAHSKFSVLCFSLPTRDTGPPAQLRLCVKAVLHANISRASCNARRQS